MTPGSPVGPPACEGYQAVATDGGYLHVARVHCNGCAETASLRERLATAERHKAELMERNANLHAAKEAALADAAALRERVTRAEALLRDISIRCLCYLRMPDDDVPCWQCQRDAFLAPTEPDGASGTKETT